MVLVYLFLLLLPSTFFPPHWGLIKLSKSKGVSKIFHGEQQNVLYHYRDRIRTSMKPECCVHFSHSWSPWTSQNSADTSSQFVINDQFTLCHKLLLLLLLCVGCLHYPEFNKAAVLILRPFLKSLGKYLHCKESLAP